MTTTGPSGNTRPPPPTDTTSTTQPPVHLWLSLCGAGPNAVRLELDGTSGRVVFGDTSTAFQFQFQLQDGVPIFVSPGVCNFTSATVFDDAGDVTVPVQYGFGQSE